MQALEHWTGRLFVVGMLLLCAARPLWAESAAFTCAPCTQNPCTAYCESEPCPGCAANEGDSLIFYGGNSTGTGISYYWDFDGDSGTDAGGSNPVVVWTFIRPNNPALYPNGWPVTLTVLGDGGSASDSHFVPIANIAPTAVPYALDVVSEPQYGHVVIYVSRTTQFHGENSSDRAFISGNGISAYAWDFDYDGFTFSPTSTNSVAYKSYSQPGSYTVRLRVTDDDTPALTAFADLTVEVLPDGPFARIAAPQEPFTEGETKRFDADPSGSAQTIASYTWDLDYDGATFDADATGQTIYTAFDDARPYTVALRVVDSWGTTYTTQTEITPLALAPTADIALFAADGTPITEPYEVFEGAPITFDGSGSAVVAPDPGQIVSFAWDFDYNGFTFLPSASGDVVTHTFLEDSAQLDPPGRTYVVRLRVADDDDTPESPSEGFAQVSVLVVDIPPTAQIEVCSDASYSDCAPKDRPHPLAQNRPGYFRVVDTSGNADAIAEVYWDTAYDGSFDADPDFDGQTEVAIAWTEISVPTLAVRIVDDDSDQAEAIQELTIYDLPPIAAIDPPGTDGLLLVDEGSHITFSAEPTQLVPGDKLTRIVWDWAAQAGPFAPNTADTAQDCDGVCSLAAWINCVGGAAPDNDCPSGPGEITLDFDDGPASSFVILCVEDSDDSGVCQQGTVFGTMISALQFAVLEVSVQNVAPRFLPDDPSNPLVTELVEGETWTWCPTVSDPGDDTLSFDCTPNHFPANMECNPHSGCLSWTPDATAISCGQGDNPQRIHLIVSDEDGASDELSADLYVPNRNDAPAITGFFGAASTAATSEYTATVYAKDPDSVCDDELSYYLCGDVEPGMLLLGDASGDYATFTWTPGPANLGSFNLGFCVHDDTGTEDCGVCYWHALSVASQGSLPVISAGDDIDTEAGRVCVTAQVVSNPGDNALAFAWRQSKGPEELCLLPLDDDPQTICTVLRQAGDYELVIEADNGQYVVEDRVAIRIANSPPQARVRAPRHWPLGTTVSLDGRTSSDVNGDALAFSWSDTLAVLDDASAAEASFIALDQAPLGIGAFDFALVCDDGELDSEPQPLWLELQQLDADGQLQAAPPHAVLTASAERVVAGERVDFDASQSLLRRADTSVTYNWTLLVRPPDSEAGLSVSAETASLTPDVSGQYRVQLVLDDGHSLSRPAQVVILAASPTNSAPTANAGPDRQVAFARMCNAPRWDWAAFSLDGRASADAEDDALNFAWTQVGGPAAAIDDVTGDTPEVIAFERGVYTFALTVDDGELTSLPDYVQVVVGDADVEIDLALDHPRWARELGTVTVNPGDAVVLDAAASSHSDDAGLRFEWTQTHGPAVALADWSRSAIRFFPDHKGVAIGFTLAACDLSGNCAAPLAVDVVVLDEANTPPSCALAESEISARVGDSVSLDASPSYDDDGDTLSFTWRQREEDSTDLVAISRADQAIATVVPLTGGTYLFEALVSDGIERCLTEPVTVSVAANRAPTADAGGDRTGCVGDVITLDGSQSADPDGHSVSYAWHIADDGNTGLSDADFAPSADVAAPTLSPFNPGEIVVELVVDDGFAGGQSEPDTLTLTIAALCEDGDTDEQPPTDGDLDLDQDGRIDGDENPPADDGCQCRQSKPRASQIPVLLMLLALALWRHRRIV